MKDLRYSPYSLDLARFDEVEGFDLLDDGTQELNFATSCWWRPTFFYLNLGVGRTRNTLQSYIPVVQGHLRCQIVADEATSRFVEDLPAESERLHVRGKG